MPRLQSLRGSSGSPPTRNLPSPVAWGGTLPPHACGENKRLQVAPASFVRTSNVKVLAGRGACRWIQIRC